MKEFLKKLLIALLIMAAAIAFGALETIDISGSDVDDCIGTETMEIIEEVADEYGVCPELIEAIVFCESSGNPNAVSNYGCVGLMQISEKHHKERMEALGVTDLTDPRSNILVGTDYLMELA